MIESIPIYKKISTAIWNLFIKYSETAPSADPINIEGEVITRQNNNPSQNEQKPFINELIIEITKGAIRKKIKDLNSCLVTIPICFGKND